MGRALGLQGWPIVVGAAGFGPGSGERGLLSSPAFKPQALPLWEHRGFFIGCDLGWGERNMMADFCDWCLWFPGAPDEGGAEKRRVRAGWERAVVWWCGGVT